jgi:hypothetical protein
MSCVSNKTNDQKMVSWCDSYGEHYPWRTSTDVSLSMRLGLSLWCGKALVNPTDKDTIITIATATVIQRGSMFMLALEIMSEHVSLCTGRWTCDYLKSVVSPAFLSLYKTR